MNIDSARSVLHDKGFTNIEINYENSETEPEGMVLSQSPDRDGKVTPSETTVELTVSKGKPTIQVMNLSGLTKEQVDNYAKGEGLDVEYTEDFSDTVEEGKVISQDPSPFTQVEKGATIGVVISKGPEETVTEPPSDPETAPDRTTTKKIEVKVKGKGKKDPVHVKIVYSDKNATDKVFAEEELTDNKEYSLPLTIAEGGSATYSVYINDKQEQTETINYDDI
jgi:serine/threonine-protein kinase